jgi:glycosyltransferase involved in cell wall biosynthesis
MSAHVLFIGHDAYRAGAQIELLHIIRWLRSKTDLEMSLLLTRGGELVPEYQAVVPTQIWPAADSSTCPDRNPLRLWRRLAHLMKVQRAVRTLGPRRLGLIYVNSVASLSVLPALLEASRCPVLCHVHELEMAVARFCGQDRFNSAVKTIGSYIAVCGAVERNLIESHGIRGHQIRRIYPGISLEHFDLPEASRADLRATLGIPARAAIVGGCGTTDWRKSPEVFLQVARSVRGRECAVPVHFIWVGASQPDELHALMHDAVRLGVQDIVHFVGAQREPRRFFSLFDVFLLTSREDPFPLVCLEAAALQVPIICFERAGGMPEFVEEDAGFVVPYLDTDAAAARIVVMLTEPELRATMGKRAAEKVRARHDIEVIAPQIAAVIRTHLTLKTIA